MVLLLILYILLFFCSGPGYVRVCHSFYAFKNEFFKKTKHAQVGTKNPPNNLHLITKNLLDLMSSQLSIELSFY